MRDHWSFLFSIHSRRSCYRNITWVLLSSNQQWTPTEHIPISSRQRGSIEGCRSNWGATLDSHHALVCTKLSMCVSGCSKYTMQQRLQCGVLSNLTPFSTQTSNDRLTRNTLNSTGLVDCGLVRRIVIFSTFESLRFFCINLNTDHVPLKLRRRMKTMNRRKKNKQCAVFNTYVSFSILHLRDIGYPLEFTIP